MGALLGSVCFNSQSEALDKFYSDAPVSVTAGTTSVTTYFEKVAGVWKLKTSNDNAGTVTTSESVAPVPTFPDCDPLQGFNDGQALGWAMAAVLVGVWGFLVIRRQVR